MPQWEYIKIDLNDLPSKASEIDLLNDAGKHAWELVLITSNNIALPTASTRRAVAGTSPTQQN
jgi:hypothetical protein